MNYHYAETNNELAQECEKKAYKVRVYTTSDSKLWFLIDNSFNLHEAETVHPETAKEDMGNIVKPFFNDLRDNKPPLPSEMWVILSELAKHEKEIGAGLCSVVEIIKLQFLKQGKEDVGPEDRPSYIG